MNRLVARCVINDHEYHISSMPFAHCFAAIFDDDRFLFRSKRLSIVIHFLSLNWLTNEKTN